MNSEKWERVKQGDNAAKEQIVAENMPLVFWVARRFIGRGMEWDDLCQVGAVGLLKAILNFEPQYGNKFSTYAVPMIMGEIRRALREDNIIHVSRSCRENIVEIRKIRREFAEEYGREATLSELAVRMQLDEGRIAEALAADAGVVSLQAPFAEGESGTLADVLAAESDAGESGEDKWVASLLLRESLERLPGRLRLVLEARYFREQTQSEVAARLGVSQVQVCRLEKQALRAVREYCRSGGVV